MGKKAMFLGGTGLISNAVTTLAVQKGWEMTLVTRGGKNDMLPEEIRKEVRFLQCDINDDDKLKNLTAGEKFDSVTQWLGFTPDRVTRDFALFGGNTGQYIYISSCAAYERPLRRWLATEDLPLKNPFWQYGRDKAASEDECTRLLRQNDFPITIVRPSLTYGDTQVPFAMNSWAKPFSLLKRLIDGRPVVVHGDGTALWTITHNTDFAKGFCGVMGNKMCIGEAYHIVGDEVMTWDMILDDICAALDVKSNRVYMSTRQIARFMPDMEGSILGDKSTSYVFDNSKIKKLVPEFICTTPFAEGIKSTVNYFLTHENAREIDREWDKTIDALVAADALVYPKD